MPAGKGSNSDNMESQSSALQGYLNDSTSIFPRVWELDSQMQDFIWQTHEGGMSWFSLIDAAIWLAAILGLLSLAVTAYKVALRQGRLDILQLLRPLFIVLALTGYFAVAKSITSLVSGVEGSFRNNYIINANAAHAAKKQRDKLQADLISEARQLQASSTVVISISSLISRSRARALIASTMSGRLFAAFAILFLPFRIRKDPRFLLHPCRSCSARPQCLSSGRCALRLPRRW